jgi:nitrite reductase/ring-hydroxylating ferredoxin subunit
MEKFISVCKVSDIAVGTFSTFKIDNLDILVANLDGQVYAVSAICPHLSGYLGNGKIVGTSIKCPVHGAEYDLKTGKITKDLPWLMKKLTKETSDLKAYKIKIENSEIKVAV